MPALYDQAERVPLARLGVEGAARCRVVMCEQQTQEWFGCRLGALSASHANVIVTSRGDPAKGQQRESYINKLVAERLLGAVEMDTGGGAACERGNTLEPKARALYEWRTGREIVLSFTKKGVEGLFHKVGFVWHGSLMAGCSPDGLCADRGMEVKCCMNKQHVATLRRGRVPSQYLPQIQFSLYITGLPAWDFVAYHPAPELPSVVWTVFPDPKTQAALDEQVPAFLADVDAAEQRVRDMLD